MDAKLSKQFLDDVGKAIKKVIDTVPLSQFDLMKVCSFDGYVQFWLTNLETYLTLRVPAETLEEGEACVHADDFLLCVRRSGDEIRVFTRDGYFVVQSDGAERKISLVSVENCPHFPDFTYQAALPTKLLLSAIEKVGFAVSKYKDAMVYKYLLVDGEGNRVNFVASDVYRLAIFRASASFSDKLLIPSSGLEVLKDLLEKEESTEVKVGRTQNFVFLAGTNWEIAFRVKYWKYPNYKAIIPKKVKMKVVIDRKELDRILEKFSDAEEIVVHIDKNLKPPLNPKLLEEITRTNNGNLEILIADAHHPVLFKLGKDFLYLVMPQKS